MTGSNLPTADADDGLPNASFLFKIGRQERAISK